MTEKVTIVREEPLPMPLIYLASAEDLAVWYRDQLLWSLDHGETELAISCFDTASMGFALLPAALCVLRAVTDLLYDHPEVKRLTIRCGDGASFRAYSLQWNMWYAPHKPPHGD